MATSAAAPALDVSKLFLDFDMREGEVVPLVAGTAVAFSARSPWREGTNEDAAAILPIEPGHVVLAVADGFGGQPGGDRASRMAIEALSKAVEQADPGESGMRGGILTGFERANEAIRAEGIGSASTLIAAEIRGPTVRSYNVGDSALLVVGQRGKLKHQTVVHSPVGYAVAAGMLDEKEAMHHEDRHFVSNMLGAADMSIEMGSTMLLSPRDTVVLGSDGLFDNLHTDEIVEIVRKGPLDEVAEKLVRRCQKRMHQPREGRPSKPDDLTFILFRQG